MKNSRSFLPLAAALLTLAGAWVLSIQPPSRVAGLSPQASSLRPLIFEPNLGQVAEDARFLARGPGYDVYLTERAAVMAFNNGDALSMRVASSDSPESLAAAGALEGSSNYFRGNEEERWITDVPHYERVRYEQAGPGVDWEFYNRDGDLEHDLILAPGADPSMAVLELEGGRSLTIDESGDLWIDLDQGRLRQRRPIAYQQHGVDRKEVPADYVLLAENRVGFTLGDYDRSFPLVIDPVVDYATYLGHNDQDQVNAVFTDADGNAYVTGATSSSQFPSSAGAFQGSRSGDRDAFVMKISSDGARILFSTFLGHTDFDAGNGIAVDSAGDVYVAGETRSSQFPVTVNSFQRQFGRGDSDAFVTKLDATGSRLIYSTFVGDTDRDWATDLAIDSSRNVYVTGVTWSSRFPTTPGSFQPQYGGDDSDAFALKLDPTGTMLLFSTFLGGSRTDIGSSIAVDSASQVYVTGYTLSNNFPVSPSPFQARRGGDEDAFVTKLAASGASVVYSTYLGGSKKDFGNGIAADLAGNAYIGGYTESDNFPLSLNAYDASYNNGGDGFITKLSPSGRPAVYSTYLGGDKEDTVNDIVVDGGGIAYVVGHTKSQNFPARSDSFQTRLESDNGDAFFAELRVDGSALTDATYYGGGSLDEARGIARSTSGALFMVGRTTSGNFPTTPSSIQPFRRSQDDGFVVKFAGAGPFTTVPAASFEPNVAVAPESIVSGFGPALALGTASAATVPLPSQLLGVRVVVADSQGFARTAALFFVSPGQINFLIPAGTAPGSASIEVFRDGFVVARGSVQIQTVAPSIFTAEASGMGVAAAEFLRASADGSRTRSFIFSGPPGNRVPVAIDLGGPADETFLLLYGTGIRGGQQVRAVIGNQEALVTFAGAQGQFVGLDQVNILLPRSLIGRGVVELVLIVDGVRSNIVLIAIR